MGGRGGYMGGRPGGRNFHNNNGYQNNNGFSNNNFHNNNFNNGSSGGPGANSNGRVICFKCGGLNHYSRDCKAIGVKCFNCNGFGHLSRDCPEGPKVQVCYKCQQEGHIVSLACLFPCLMGKKVNRRRVF